MQFEWDDRKDAVNRAKHGLPLADAALLDWTNVTRYRDTRHDYGETRIVALALLNGRVHVCVYTRRQGRIRVISLRKAKGKEVRNHEQAQIARQVRLPRP